MDTKDNKNYLSLKSQIDKQEREVSELYSEYIRLKNNKRKIEVKSIKEILKAERKQLKRLYKKKKAYINVKAEMKKILNAEADFINGEITKARRDIELLSARLKIRLAKGKYSKNLPSHYIDEIKENVNENFNKVEDNINLGTIKRKLGILGLIGAIACSITLFGVVIKSIKNAPKDLYPNAEPKLDKYSELIKNIEEGNTKEANRVANSFADEDAPSPKVNYSSEKNEAEVVSPPANEPEEEEKEPIRVHYIK